MHHRLCAASLSRDEKFEQLLFTAGRDGSVCLRTVGALEDIAVQVSSRCGRPTSWNWKEEEEIVEAGTGWEVTFLSEPVGALTGGGGARHTLVKFAVWRKRTIWV